MARRLSWSTRIPGLSFSWKRAVGLSGARQRLARETGIPTTRSGMERKIGRLATKGCLVVISIWGAMAILAFAVTVQMV